MKMMGSAQMVTSFDQLVRLAMVISDPKELQTVRDEITGLINDAHAADDAAKRRLAQAEEAERVNIEMQVKQLSELDDKQKQVSIAMAALEKTKADLAQSKTSLDKRETALNSMQNDLVASANRNQVISDDLNSREAVLRCKESELNKQADELAKSKIVAEQVLAVRVEAVEARERAIDAREAKLSVKAKRLAEMVAE